MAQNENVSSTCGPTSHVVVKQYSKQNTLLRYYVTPSASCVDSSSFECHFELHLCRGARGSDKTMRSLGLRANDSAKDFQAFLSFQVFVKTKSLITMNFILCGNMNPSPAKITPRGT